MTYSWALWKPKVEVADVRFLPSSDVPNSGFASVYRYSESDALSMQNADTFKSFKGVVHNEALLVDFDTEEAFKSAYRWLAKEGVGFEVFTTGNRGKHVHIPRTVAPSHVLPALDKAFVSGTFPGADLSIYHHVAFYRQVGCVHKKSGRKKALEETVEGKPLEYSDLDTESGPSYSGNSQGMQSVFTDRILAGLTVPITNGRRHEHFIKVAIRLDQLGQPQESAFYYLVNLSLICAPILEDNEIKRIVNWAYNERAK